MATTVSDLPADKILRLLIDDAMDAFIVSDQNNVVLFWSRFAETLFGWTSEEALGQTLTTLIIPPDKVHAHELGVARYLQTGVLQVLNKRVEVTGMSKQGHLIPVEMVVTPLHLDGRVLFASSIRDNAERTMREHKLMEQAALLDLSTDAIVVTSDNDVIEYWNAGARTLFGFDAEQAVGRVCAELMATRFPVSRENMRATLEREGHWEGKLVYTTRHGLEVHALSRYVLERNAGGHAQRILISSTDMRLQEKLLRSEARREESEQRFREFYEHHADGIFELDLKGRFTSVNQALTTLSGFSRDELLGTARSLVPRERHADLGRYIKRALGGEPVVFDTVMVAKDGRHMDVRSIFLPQIVNESIGGIHGILKNISEQKDSERRIQYLATHDALTGLPNRSMLGDRLRHAIDQARRLGNYVGVLFLDLNRFKVINDSLGHDQGDILLKEVACRLQGLVRATDTVGRLGGDEFVIVLEHIDHHEDIAIVADNIYAAVSEPIQLITTQVSVTTSIGASVYPDDGDDVSTLLKNADLAMYEAKRKEKGTFRFFDKEMNRRATERLRAEESLRQSLDRSELIVQYQPIISLATGALAGIEALVRWQHPERGLILPNEFIPLSEEIGFIHAIGEWVLEQACEQNRRWQEEGLPPMLMSVNLSAVQLGSDRFCETLQQVLARTGLDGQWLQLEVTESMLMQDVERSSDMLQAIRDTGVSISIDDFGTGYSSLSHLRKLPIDALKIDRSFISDLENHPDDAVIVSATITLAHGLGLTVVAEGVTTAAQEAFLHQQHCNAAQGFLYSEALSAAAMRNVMQNAAVNSA